LIVAPTLDRYVRAGDMRAAVNAHPRAGLTLETPETINKFDQRLQKRVFDWLAAHLLAR